MMVELEHLRKQLLPVSSVQEKISLLDAHPQVRSFFKDHRPLLSFVAGLTPECELVLKELAAIDQAERLFAMKEGEDFPADLARALLEKLLPVEQFYREMGGLVGYQAQVLHFLQGENRSDGGESSLCHYHAPHFQDLTAKSDLLKEAVSWGLESLPEIAEMYPLGGAADRLHLVDEQTGNELPAAKLPFAGRTLLETLIRDLQARERLYFKKYGVQLATPVAMMTSQEKNNHAHVLQICADFRWFGRPKEAFRFFCQPLVPMVNSEGKWCMTGPFKPIFKPGGHGAIWKLARDAGVLAWLAESGRRKALLRQINNPLAGLDDGLLAFLGYGWKKDMVFGFASCPRLLQAAEGVNVLVERKKEDGIEVVLTNIEYCDFEKWGIRDAPLREGEPYSRFTSNTNILFADLQAIGQAIETCPYPGLLVNFKKTSYTAESGEKKEETAARLESTMQNIADVFAEKKPHGSSVETSRTFATYNHRHKTISTAKKAFIPGKPLQETPENCFFDLLAAHRELLQDVCGFRLPPRRTVEEYLEKGPECLFLYHPALGPLYSLIGEKLRKGSLNLGSELLLEIADFSASELQIEGSLQIEAERILGHWDAEGILRYSSQVGSCVLKNVAVRNRGVDWKGSRPFWKMHLQRFETLKIELKGHSRFIAEDVSFTGNHTFLVEDGLEMRVSQKDGKLRIETVPLIS